MILLRQNFQILTTISYFHYYKNLINFWFCQTHKSTSLTAYNDSSFVDSMRKLPRRKVDVMYIFNGEVCVPVKKMYMAKIQLKINE